MATGVDKDGNGAIGVEDEDDGELDGNHGGADNGCIDFDTIETYTANVQNKKRIFADEILRT
jgi:hypothetical protein